MQNLGRNVDHRVVLGLFCATVVSIIIIFAARIDACRGYFCFSGNVIARCTFLMSLRGVSLSCHCEERNDVAIRRIIY